VIGGRVPGDWLDLTKGVERAVIGWEGEWIAESLTYIERD
jgi:hypothetical protein